MRLPTALAICLLVFLFPACSAPAADGPKETVSPVPITYGSETQRGFLNDNVYHSELGEIHYSSYIPESYDGSGETGSLVMGMRPELYTAYLMVSSQWDGDLEVLAQAKTPVYLVTGEQDSYYGSDSMKNAAAQLHTLYEQQGLSEEEIDRLLVLDIKPQSYFADRGISDQHGGGMLIAKDKEIMGWLFGQS